MHTFLAVIMADEYKGEFSHAPGAESLPINADGFGDIKIDFQDQDTKMTYEVHPLPSQTLSFLFYSF